MSHQLPGHDHDDTRRTARDRRGLRTRLEPGARDIAVAGGLIALTGGLFWLVVGGAVALLTPWIAP
jgi:hypothetical protein